MTATILITGFGPFPGAPYNPTQPLVRRLVRRRHPAFAGVRRRPRLSGQLEAVDRELPALIAREHPDAGDARAGAAHLSSASRRKRATRTAWWWR
jgi:pyroglutamyl-peptidase